MGPFAHTISDKVGIATRRGSRNASPAPRKLAFGAIGSGTQLEESTAKARLSAQLLFVWLIAAVWLSLWFALARKVWKLRVLAYVIAAIILPFVTFMKLYPSARGSFRAEFAGIFFSFC